MLLQVHHEVQRQIRPFCHLLVHLQWLFKVDSKVYLQLQHYVHHEVYHLLQHQVHH